MRRSKRRLPKAFVKRPDLWFEFQLARELHMTVAELRTTMSNEEFHLWNLFLSLEHAQNNMKEA